MKFQISAIKLFNRLWFYNLIVVLLLSAQFIILEHSTAHPFHVHTDYCLKFQTASASPSLIASKIHFELPTQKFENISSGKIYSIAIPFRKYFFTRAPPVFV